MKLNFRIDSIWDGIAPSSYFGPINSYDGAVAVDPDFPISSSHVRTSGFLCPVAYTDFSGANVTAYPIAHITTPKNTNLYTVLSNGRLISYSSALVSETLIGTVTGGVAKGAVYYNNYIYIFTGTDVSRYGPLDDTPALTNTVWTGATLGSQTALTNTTYPSIRGLALPNHWAHVHGDGQLYFLDFKNGQGMVHAIKTTKTTAEGDTNDGSAYNVLDLPFGYYPTAIAGYGTDVAILAIQTTDTTVNQGPAALFLWDSVDPLTFYRGPMPLPDPLATALLNKNGILHIWSGNASNGVRLSQYIGGDSIQDVEFQEEGTPPHPGAVDALGNRIVWGSWQTYPSASVGVSAFGSKDANLPKGVHNIVKSSSAGANGNVTALKFIQQASNITPKLVVGWGDDSNKGIDSYSTSGTLASSIRWLFNIGREFHIESVRIPLAASVAANTSITPKFYFDNTTSASSLTAINNTNNPSKKKVRYSRTEMENYNGDNYFIFELNWVSTNPLPVALPIDISVDVHADETD